MVKFAAVLLALLPLTACGAADTPAEFESPAPVAVADVLPARILAHPAYVLRPEAASNGWSLTFEFEAPAGEPPVTGIQPLLNRAREFQAIAALRDMSKSEEFSKAIAEAGSQKIESVKQIVENPVESARNLPQGASRFLGNLGKSVQKVVEGEAGASDFASGVLGVEKKKAELAIQLGVTPFTRDPVLAEELQQVAQASAAGSSLLKFSGLILPGGIGMTMSAINLNESFQRALVESTPAELAARNREALLALGAPSSEVSAFLASPAYNPWQKAAATAILRSIGANPSPLLPVLASTDRDGAVRFLQVLRMFASHHSDAAAITAFRNIDGVPAAVDSEGTLVVPVPADRLEWTPRTLAWVESLGTSNEGDTILLVAGSVSGRAAGELSRRGVACAPSAKGGIE